MVAKDIFAGVEVTQQDQPPEPEVRQKISINNDLKRTKKTNGRDIFLKEEGFFSCNFLF